MVKTILALAMFMSTVSAAADEKDTLAKVEAWRAGHEAEIIRAFAELLAIPNVASDTVNIRRNAEYIAAQLERRGVSARLLETPGSPPTVFGELAAPGAKKTVVVYAHYDGQPADPRDWTSPPWQPVMKNEAGALVPMDQLPARIGGEWRILARSAGDDKAAVMAVLAALDAMRAQGITPSVNLKFYFEGEEEAGSPHLEASLRAHADLLKADGWFFCDGPVHQSRRPLLAFGARGVTGAQLTVYGPSHDLHSGHYGNWAPNPIALLVDLLAAMRDTDGHILIPGLYDDVRSLTAAENAALAAVPDVDADLRAELDLGATEAGNARLVERIMLPALNFRGIKSGGVGELTRNAIPTEATAAIGFRLVPDQKPERIRELTETFIRSRGWYLVHETPTAEERRAHARVIRVDWESGYRASRTALDAPFSRAVIGDLSAGLATTPVLLPSFGGSLPMHIFEDILAAPMIVLPVANHDDNQHGADENLRVQNLWDGIDIYVLLFAELGKSW